MSQTLLSLQPFWGTQSSLTALVPANQVWVDVAGDSSAMPYVVLKQEGQSFDWCFSSHYISKTKFSITIYAATLASVDQITTAVIAAFKWAAITTNGMACRLDDQTEAGEEGGAYKASTNWTLFEAF